MSVRFRIRTPQGQELSFASQAVFVEFVRSGDLAPEDIVYDGETNEWAPARTHPLVLEIQYEEEERAEAAARAAAEEATASEAPDAIDEEESGATELTAADLGLALTDALPAPPPREAWSEEVDPVEAGALEGLGDLGLDLAPPVGASSPDEEAATFLRKMQAERAMDLDAPSGGGLGIRMEDSGSLAGMIAKPDSPTMADRPEPKPPKPQPRRVEAPRKKASGALKAAVFLAVTAVLGVGVWLGTSFLEEPAIADPVDVADTVGVVPDEPPPPPPVIASTPEAVRARAQERFLTATQTSMRDLEPIPDSWLSGEYFVLPSDHDYVRAVWQRYLDVVRSVRATDVERYRAAYERALDDAGVRDDARLTRLQTAMDAFGARSEARNAHWDRAEAIAVAAIQSHNALVEAEGLVLYDPAGATGRASGIGAGLTGRDSDTQLLLTQVIQLIEGRLLADGMGPREGANVREWVWGGFLDAVAH